MSALEAGAAHPHRLTASTCEGAHRISPVGPFGVRGGLLAAALPAKACSCFQGDPRDQFDKAEAVPVREFMATPTDVFIPAALGGMLSLQEVEKSLAAGRDDLAIRALAFEGADVQGSGHEPQERRPLPPAPTTFSARAIPSSRFACASS